MEMKQALTLVGRSLLNALFPRYCCVCGRRLSLNEQHLCATCLLHLPLTHLKGKKDNFVERAVWDDAVCTERANSLLYYQPKSACCQVFFLFKYYNHPEIAVAFGRMMAQDLAETDFFAGVDVLLPVPLARKRFKERGYNQSERLAYGISELTGIPIDTTSVARTRANQTQTHLTFEERRANVDGIFKLVDAEALHGKHVLIVDDVITTGSTTRACAHAVVEAGDVRISVISLGCSESLRAESVPSWIRP